MSGYFSSMFGGSRQTQAAASGYYQSMSDAAAVTQSADASGSAAGTLPPYATRHLTRGHDDYTELLRGSDVCLDKPKDYTPFARGGATSYLRSNIDSLATLAAKEWTSDGIPMDRATARSTILSGVPCPNAPAPSTRTEADYLGALHQAMADNDPVMTYNWASKLVEMGSQAYAHMLECSYANNTTCKGGPTSRHLSSLLIQTDANLQWGCTNVNFDTPGHADFHKHLCNDPYHRPADLLNQLEYERGLVSQVEDPSTHVATMDRIMQNLEHHRAQYYRVYHGVEGEDSD
ncbi:hypothetical protein I316_03420 [Kwoniella heveanensis BCC8398]|uniref:Uncharacterized protein n=1 Tax=Kwoniella heveanensis BCC8398 TaxID=1296120 RepID=A0A1B9GV07_9TREE|nr:hypothetical protein I316_03420 [Kwoniella heveanensis BCC8398]